MKHTASILALLLFVVSCATHHVNREKPVVGGTRHVNREKLVIEGDSIVAWMSNYLTLYDASDLAIPGSRTSDVMSRWDAALSYSPTVIFLHVGVNNIAHGADVAAMEDAMGFFAESCKAKSIHLVVDNIGTDTQYTDEMLPKLNAYNTWLATTFADTYSDTVVVLDFLSWAEHGSGDPRKCQAAMFDTICVHLSDAGKVEWSKVVNSAILAL